MTAEGAAAGLLIALPVAFNLSFFLLGRSFDYPDILRQPTDHVLRRFHDGGAPLRLLWWCFMLTAVLFAPLAVLMGQVMAVDGHVLVPVTVVFGVMAAVVQFLGLARWPFVVPHLARSYLDPGASQSTKDANVAVFEALHRYVGVGVGECLGYLFTGVWSVLVGIVMTQSEVFDPWLGWPGIVIGAGLVLGSAEFVGSNEEHGWALAGVLVPVAYVAWSLWLVVAGVVLLVG